MDKRFVIKFESRIKTMKIARIFAEIGIIGVSPTY